ncbi:unnamed protein product [Rhizoctonia solani]|uniref:Uncharacterized protein n=1 Tax=Rhizoctonia solani TaxID=456999 RepID=A0A8H3GDU9_9AGAM|nr:unnamed protein product [Rhizoctonia solani]
MSKGQKKRAESIKLMNVAVSPVDAFHLLSKVTNIAQFGYTINVGFGSSPTYSIDSKDYVETSTLIKQGDKKFKTRYTGGSAIGAHYKDLLIISSSLNTPDMDF